MNKYWENEFDNYVNEKLRNSVTEGYADRFPKKELPPRAQELHGKALRYIAEAEAAIELQSSRKLWGKSNEGIN